MKDDTYRKRLQKKSHKYLKAKAIEVFNAWIRERDKDKPCISCGRYGVVLDAGHYYSAGKYQSVRFDERNVNGQCHQCNRFDAGKLIEYREGIERRWGSEVLEDLKVKTGLEKQMGAYKLDRFALIEIIVKYREYMQSS